jgi:SNF2 family DNA or RNA helicase
MKEDYKFKVPPFKHQLQEWKRSREMPYFAIFWEMGTGKSKLILDTASWLWDQGKINAVLIVANKGSYGNWADKHIPEHLAEHIKYKVAVWDAAKTDKSLLEISLMLKEKLTLRILIMNVEALAYDKGRKLFEQYGLNTQCLCVIDESTSIKNPKALRTKTALKYRRLFKYRRILTGSPVTNGPLNLYGQSEFLGDWLLGHSSYYSFRNEYCNMIEMRAAGRSFKKVVSYKNLEKLQDKIRPWSTVIKKEECLDLPPKVYETYAVELTPEQVKIYQDLKEQSIAELSQGIVTVELVLTKLLRLQQILCGYVPNENEVVVDIPEKRLDTLLEILEETGGKAIIWARFVRDIEKIMARLGVEYGDKSAVAYYGKINSADRISAVNKFQDGPARFFVGNQQTGGYGITLTAASTVIYYSNSFDLETRVQSEDRCHRIGQTKSVTYVDLYCPKTVDEKILKSLKDKKKISDLIIAPGSWRSLF